MIFKGPKPKANGAAPTTTTRSTGTTRSSGVKSGGTADPYAGMTDEEAMNARAAKLKMSKVPSSPPVNIPADDGLSLPPRPPVDIPAAAWGYGQVQTGPPPRPQAPGRREKRGFWGNTVEYCQDCIANAGQVESLERELAAAKRVAAEALADRDAAQALLTAAQAEVRTKDFQIGELFQQLREASQ